MAEPIKFMQFVKDVQPQERVDIGNGHIMIEAAPFGVIASVAQQLQEVGQKLAAQGVDWENYQETENVVKIAVTLLNDFPTLLAKVANVDQGDLEAAPPDVVIKIVQGVIAANMKSKDTLLKNWQSLAESLQKLQSKGKKKVTKK